MPNWINNLAYAYFSVKLEHENLYMNYEIPQLS